MALRNRINKLLKDSGKRPIDLARYAGVTRATVADWRSGKTKSITSENAFKVAAFFSVSAEWVATGRGAEKKTDKSTKWHSPRHTHDTECDKNTCALMFETLNEFDIGQRDRIMLEQFIECLYKKYKKVDNQEVDVIEEREVEKVGR